MADLIFCNRCGGQNPSATQFCAHCGSSLSPGASALAPPTPADAITAPPLIASQAYPGRVQTYAGFWLRVIAAIIDAIIVQSVVWPVTLVIGFVIGVAGTSVQMPHAGIRLVAIIVGATLGMAAHWIYEATMESSSRQATLGKMVLGLTVTDVQGRRISFARATGRNFAKYLSSMIFGIGYMMAGLTERKQALHDMIAGTLVWRP
jgi:uncharacterized RDD family membrane protein YckC